MEDERPSQFEAHQCLVGDGTCFKVSLRKLSLLRKLLCEQVGVGVSLDERSEGCCQRHLCSKNVCSRSGCGCLFRCGHFVLPLRVRVEDL